MDHFLKPIIIGIWLCIFSSQMFGQCEALFTFDETDITIQFTDLSTSSAGDPIVSWFWFFDDGTTSNLQNPLHTFPSPDRYDVELTITTASGCTSNIEVRIEICAFTVNISQSACNANGFVTLTIFVTDVYDNADEINILVDGVIIPGSPFDIDANNPVSVNYDILGDGLTHQLDVISDDIETCSKTVFFTVPDCTSNCFLSSMAVNISGGISHTVNVGDDFFSPVNTTIQISDVVNFNWVGSGHSTTSDVTSGLDSWNSGVIGIGSSYDVNILNPGIHPYYCIPHGGPGGSGMAGSIIANCPPGNNFSLDISFNTTIADPQGFNLYIDGVLAGGSPFNYNGTGPQNVQTNFVGDGQPHNIEIEDVADPTCTASRNWTAPDCGAAPQCNLSLSAIENGACNTNDEVPVDVTINAINPGAAGFNITVNGVPNSGNPFSYTAGGVTNISILIPGNGLNQNIVATDIADPTCSGSVSITTTNCTIPCSITNLSASTGSSIMHTVFVEDFVFNPANITIADGDIVEWQWTGAIDHTSTSDANVGADSWESGLLGTGATYQSPVLSTGVHPYYCIPHGNPGNVGMAGTITVQANCTNGEVSVGITFDESGGSFNGFTVLVDGNNVGTFSYDASGTTTVSVNVIGDGQSHSIEIVDADDPTCSAITNITTPDCNASTCQLNLSAVENGGCSANNTVPIDLTVGSVGGGANGFNVLVDGNNVGTYSYDASGTTLVSIDVMGDGQSHSIEIIDVDDPTCTATTNITTTNCVIPCSLTNLSASTGSSTTHTVLVEDFVFNPVNITIADGDIVEWQWTGAIDHTSTSDANGGADSWESGLLGTGATYQSPVLSTGVHPYYCIPHGNPGNVGMAGTITVQANCTNGEVSVGITFDEIGGSFNGFTVLVDGNNVGTFSYDASGTTTVSVNVIGDGQSHSIEIVDADDPTCSAITNITTPDCNASTCQLNLSAVENGGCSANNTVPVDLTVGSVGGGANGFNVLVDGNNVGTFSYDASGTTLVSIDVMGDGQSHSIEIIDVDDPTCTATTNITTTNCVIPCMLSNLSASTGSSTTHTVLVEDFVFNPVNITIADGDIVEWQWTGAIDHTSTSDANGGADSWESGLLGTGATYQSPVLSTGVHPYYCIPHGNPGNVGMAGTITVQANCTNGEVSVGITFDETGGSFNGFTVLVDGNNVGTFSYDASGTTTVSVNVIGDGQSHSIEIVDADDPTCSAITNITTPDCNASTCQLNLSAVENGGCSANNTVPVDLSVGSVGGGANGFNVLVDGNNVGTYSYDASGTTLVSIDVMGDGQSHSIEIIDVDDPTCTATTNITTTNCVIPCSLTNLSASTGSSTTHTVLVEDFVFNPVNITIADGDIVEWQWTGAIDHTSTSDANGGADSWESGLLGTGATYQSPVLSTGVHPYYCIPHGNPGNVGMAGTITVQANCTNGEVSVGITFDESGGSFNGFTVLVDGNNVGTFSYDASGTTTVSVNVIGDGQSHSIEIVDADDPTCSAITNITTPDCNASTCQLNLSAVENGGCSANNTVPVDLSVGSVGGGANGFNVLVDGNNVGTFSYDASGTTLVSIDVIGDGQSHSLEIIDVDDPTCSATTNITTTNCVIPCSLTNLSTSTGSSTTHTVLVEDFVFNPVNITIADGDIVEWQWTGAIDHTSTSDANGGADSWESGLLGTGATYQSPVLSTGVHPYYCIPHGNPGNVGMAGTITVQANCTNGEVSVGITFDEIGGSFNGFTVLVDGNNVGTFSYDASGTTTVSVNVIGDGQSHSIEIVDADDPTCSAITNITTPDCNASTCQLNLSAVENGGCSANNTVPVDLTVGSVGGGANGFNVLVDGNNVGTFSYDASGTTLVSIDVMGDGQSHSIEIIDVDDPTCTATTNITTTNCVIPCMLSNLSASTGSSTTHTVLVEDFVFNPVNITIADGDIVEWQWTGAIDHTSTSDANGGADSWESGLLGTGATYQSPVLSTGVHPYYCIPHGNPGNVGMAGTITVQANCTNGEVSVGITFDETGGSFNGFTVLVDGNNVGTFSYDASGTTTVSVNVIGDGQSHSIEIVDADDPTCSAITNITTPDCNASTCQLNLSAVENGGCSANNTVPIDLTVGSVGGGANGFNVLVDGNNVGTYSYDASGTTLVSIDVMGDGQSHSIEIIDVDDPTCTATTNITTTNCVIPCSLTNLSASTGSSTTHTVLVEDFVFNPVNITIADGDIVEWQWTGAIDHTSTSDANGGADSWESGLLGTGATYQSPVLSTGVHPYYCIPHGNPGNVGMAGTITVQANCTNGEVSVGITFDESGGSFNGFTVLVDGNNVGTFSYDASGTTTVSVNVIGDGQSHSIEIVDADDPTCSAITNITTPDCNASTCQLNLSAVENGGCSANNTVPIDLTVGSVGGGANGFNVLVDGNNVGTYSYDASGTTLVSIDVMGDGQSHSIEIIDVDDPTCTATTNITTTNCVIPCSLTNLSASTGSSTTHTVLVEDFVFNPVNITIADGDIVEWQWTGAIDHTSTSDANGGADSWESGLLGTGATYQSPVLSTGVHPYYCIPHGNPGNVGMAGTITVQANCTNGEVSVGITFDESGGSFNGFTVLVDGNNVGTYSYNASGTTTVSVNVIGDGQSHSIEIVDADDPTCSAITNITTPDCNASTCQLNLSAVENGGCSANNTVPIDLTVGSVGGGANGFNVLVDGNNVGTFGYDASGTTLVSIDVIGDGQSHSIEIIDVDDPTCTATTNITTTNCVIPCVLSNLVLSDVSNGNPATHTVEVRDFDFVPKDITINAGDQVHFDWTGAIPHTSTSDVSTGIDSWDSELLGQGATFDVTIENEGLHPYYCIPHGTPGGVGMAGTITATPQCNNGEVSVEINFAEENGSFEGFNLYVDNVVYPGSPFNYANSGINNIIINIIGDGGTHEIRIVDSGNSTCFLEGQIQVTDCAVSDPCSLELSAVQNGYCDANNQVQIDLTINSQNIGSGYNLFVNDILYTGSPFSYNASNPTTQTIFTTGTGENRLLRIQDVDSTSCSSTSVVNTTLCGPVCEILNIQVSNQVRHFVEVRDFDFFPLSIDVLVGDTVQFNFTGQIPHTTTSDATSGPDAWDSNLLTQDSTFEIIVQESGTHPYYCIPHGGPGGVGMSGVINAASNCNNGIATMELNFETTNGSPLGYNVFLDGDLILGPINYDDPTGFNSILINVPGDSSVHLITVQDLEIGFCAATASFVSPFCEVLCLIENLAATTGGSLIHEIEVRDFDFFPQQVTVRAGETVQFNWTGVVPHTATTDVLTGPESWDSGLLGQGDSFERVIATPGNHPYYCIPHGGPGGIGMAGMIESLPDCENGEVSIELNFNVTSGSAQGYNIFVDGNPIPANPINYDDPTGLNTYLISIPGDGAIHLITVQDVETSFCAATTQVEVADCNATCEISNAQIDLIPPTTHIVEVADFEFIPKDINIELGDTVRFIWIDQIPHTTTSDNSTGVDVWDSGLLGLGEVYDLVLTTDGLHPYYCIPHGDVGGIGMAGSINVDNNSCQNGFVDVNISFNSQAGSPDGYNILVDNVLDPSGPFTYNQNGVNQLTTSIPGDGSNHVIRIEDAIDQNCFALLNFISPNCSTNCSLDGTVEMIGDCNSDGLIPYEILILNQNSSTQYNLTVDTNLVAGSPFFYGSNDSTLISIDLPGDGLNHLIEVSDIDSSLCSWSIQIPTEDCSPDCLMAVSQMQTGECDGQGNVEYTFTIEVDNPGANGFELLLDGSAVNGSPFAYTGNTTVVKLDIPAIGMAQEIRAADVDDSSCFEIISFTTVDCSLSCSLSGLSIEVGVPNLYVVDVRDFDFLPKDITVELGDTIRWNWTGVIPHTATSDTLSGDDSWNSGLIGQGSTFDFVISNIGYHPYYCVPHGSPGGVGMAGSITVVDPCDDGYLNTRFTFINQNSSLAGYSIEIDGTAIPESPQNYSGTGLNTFTTEILAEGQTLNLLIQDLEEPDCQIDSTFEMPSCNDPCLGFEALYDNDINHQTLEVQFNCTVPGVTSWAWDFGNGTTADVQNPIVIYDMEGSYEVCITIENAQGCIANLCDSITVGIYQCQANFDFQSDGLTVNFFDQSVTTDSITNWTWSFGNGLSLAGSQNPTFTYSDLDIYEVCLTIEAGGCQSDTCMTLDLSNPCLSFSADYAYTINLDDNSVQFIDLSPGNVTNWLWGFGDTNTSNEQDPIHFYDAPGIYNVCLLIQDTDLGCNNSLCQTINMTTTGIKETGRNQSLIIYPNPAKKEDISWNVKGLKVEDFNQLLPVKIYDINGKTVFYENLRGEEEIVIRLKGNLASSIYFIEIKGENTVYRGKVVVH